MMKKVYADFPESADAASLYTGALNVQHPWDLYYNDYEPKSWTPKRNEAAAIQQKAKNAFLRSDIKITSAVF